MWLETVYIVIIDLLLASLYYHHFWYETLSTCFSWFSCVKQATSPCDMVNCFLFILNHFGLVNCVFMYAIICLFSYKMKCGRPIKACSKSSKQHSSIPSALVSPKKCLLWINQPMLAAINAVQSGSSSINKTAICHGVPRTTLQDRLSWRKIHGTKPGPAPYLNKNKEVNLSEFLEVVSDVGYGKTKKQIKRHGGVAARDKGVLRK